MCTPPLDRRGFSRSQTHPPIPPASAEPERRPTTAPRFTPTPSKLPPGYQERGLNAVANRGGCRGTLVGNRTSSADRRRPGRPNSTDHRYWSTGFYVFRHGLSAGVGRAGRAGGGSWGLPLPPERSRLQGRHSSIQPAGVESHHESLALLDDVRLNLLGLNGIKESCFSEAMRSDWERIVRTSSLHHH